MDECDRHRAFADVGPAWYGVRMRELRYDPDLPVAMTAVRFAAAFVVELAIVLHA